MIGTTTYYEKQLCYYEYLGNRKIDASNLLKNFNGFIVCDAFPGYDKQAKSGKPIKLQRCWVHARRHFTDILKSISGSNEEAESILKNKFTFRNGI